MIRRIGWWVMFLSFGWAIYLVLTVALLVAVAVERHKIMKALRKNFPE